MLALTLYAKRGREVSNLLDVKVPIGSFIIATRCTPPLEVSNIMHNVSGLTERGSSDLIQSKEGVRTTSPDQD